MVQGIYMLNDVADPTRSSLIDAIAAKVELADKETDPVAKARLEGSIGRMVKALDEDADRLTDSEILDRMYVDAIKSGDKDLVKELMALDDSDKGQKERAELVAAGRVIYG